MTELTTTAIHRRVAALRAGADPTVLARLTSGWAVLGDPQAVGLGLEWRGALRCIGPRRPARTVARGGPGCHPGRARLGGDAVAQATHELREGSDRRIAARADADVGDSLGGR